MTEIAGIDEFALAPDVTPYLHGNDVWLRALTHSLDETLCHINLVKV